MWNRDTAVFTSIMAVAGGIVGGIAGGRVGAAVGAGIGSATGLGVSSKYLLEYYKTSSVAVSTYIYQEGIYVFI